MKFSDGYYNHHPMVDFYNSMDPQIYAGGGGGSSGSHAEMPKDMDLGIRDIGMSVPLGISAANVQGVYSKIRMGAGHLELGFPGMGAGQRNAQTPGMYGQDQRQALRELGLINEVKFTTHAAYNVMGMTGADQQGNFALTRARMAQKEVERAIDFAADVAGGGAVVVHTGEFERPLTEVHVTDRETGREHNWSRDETGRLMFKKRITEDADAQFTLVDDRTGQAFTTAQKDRLVAYPVWNRAKEDYQGEDQNGNPLRVRKGEYIDYWGRKIIDPMDPERGRVPEYDPQTKRFKTTYLSYDNFKEHAEEYNEWFRWKNNREPSFYQKRSQTEAYLNATMETNAGHSRGWALQYGQEADTMIEGIRKLREMEKFYRELDKNIPEKDKWKIMMRDAEFANLSKGILAPEEKHPLDIVKERIHDMEKRLEFARQASTSQEQQAKDIVESAAHIVEPTKYIEQQAIRGYAESAIHAMEKSKDPNNPIFIAMENLFPERFGGHPQELKWLIQTARKKMVDLLTEPTYIMSDSPHEGSLIGQNEDGTLYAKKTANPWYRPGLSQEEAEKLAETHIKATVDPGHANLWRKFYQRKPGQTWEQAEKDFEVWLVDQIEDLAKHKMIGNFHLADNLGYHDEHLAPGQGNVPYDEIIKVLKRHGYDKAYTVEPGADASTDISDFHGLMKTWRHFGSSIYDMGGSMSAGMPRQTWADVHYSYFGQNKPPYYIFGGYAPSNDWTLWTAVPLE